MRDGGGNRFQNALPVGHDVIVVEAQNTKTFAGEKDITARVALLLLGFEMLAAIDFYDEVCSMTHEVHDVWANGRLAAKTGALQSVAP
jgi:hypothetical protein